MNSAELKSQGLLGRIAKITSTYENEIADLRVDFTLLSQEAERLTKENEELRAENESLKLQSLNTEVVDEVPQEDPSADA